MLCFAGYSDHNAMRLVPHQAHESVLRTLHPASQDIRSLMAQKKQMSASQPLVFPLRHYIKKTPDIISGANQIRGTTQILCFCLQSTQYA
jgi:hypothetical protein